MNSTIYFSTETNDQHSFPDYSHNPSINERVEHDVLTGPFMLTYCEIKQTVK